MSDEKVVFSSLEKIYRAKVCTYQSIFIIKKSAGYKNRNSFNSQPRR